jgi:DNA-binding CsgD family transcriptional regulator
MSAMAGLIQLRQLCCLGLPQETFMPEFLRSLEKSIPSLYTAAAFLDDRGAVQRIYTEHPTLAEAGQEYAIRHANSEDESRAWGCGTIAQSVRAGAIENAWHADTDMTRSVYFNEVVRPFSIRHQFRAAFRTSTGLGGALYLARGKSDGHFAHRDEQMLAATLPYLSHAVNTVAAGQRGLVPTGEAGLLIIDAAGDIQYLDQQARSLLLLAGDGWLGRSPTMSMLLNALAKDMHNVSHNLYSQPPQRRHRATSGEYVFRARWLDHRNDAGQGMIAVTLQRFVPAKLKAAEKLSLLPLSARQKQLCLGIVEGHSFADIATQFGVRPNTVSDYARVVYEKLDVQSREELKALLLR